MNRVKDHQIRKFNPGAFQSDEEVIEQFKVRHHELQTVLEILDDNIEAPSCQHTLILGPRGQGKTMLLARTAAELRSNERFSEGLLSVRFMEESQEIFNMADFWLEALFHLARECQQFDPQLGHELNIRHSVLSKKWGSDSLEDLARNAVLDVADQLDRKLVLMIENLQSLFEDVDESFGWKLRKVLQTEPQIILVGSAIKRFEGLDNAKHPFFELFWIIDLKPLDTIECQQLWTMLSGQDISEREIRPLEILTGGSPRLLVIVASFAKHKSMRQLMEELVSLIDEHTDYFRGNLEVLSKTERRVFLAVMDLWQPSTPSEISNRARMGIRTVSTMLGRLVNRQVVTVEGGGRKRRYVAAERLYSIYYKLRRNRDEAAVVQNLIRFMSVFYTEAEQTEVFSALFEEMAESEVIREALYRAMIEDPEIAEKLVTIAASNGPREISHREDLRLAEMLVTSFDKGDFAKVIQTVDKELSSGVLQLRESTIAGAMLMKAAAYWGREDLAFALFTVSEFINRWGSAESPVLQQLTAGALVIKSQVLQAQGQVELALSTLEVVIERFSFARTSGLQVMVSFAFMLKIMTLYMADESTPDVVFPVVEEGIAFIKTTAHTELSDSRRLFLQKNLAEMLMLKGDILHTQGKIEFAKAAFEEVVDRFGNVENLELRTLSTRALINKADLQINNGNIQDALFAYDEIIQHLSKFAEHEKTELTWRALRGRTKVLLIQGDLPGAVDSFQSLYGILDPNSEAKIRVIVNIAINLVAAGVAPHTLLEILSSSDVREDALRPVIVALRQEAGETVRAPKEILEVASDIREDIQEQRKCLIKEEEIESSLPQSK